MKEFYDPIQIKMAMTALNLTTRSFADELGCSAMAVSKVLNGKKLPNVERNMQAYFTKKRVYFGPCYSVSINQDIFKQDRFFIRALFQLCRENGIMPSSSELLEASKRSKDER